MMTSGVISGRSKAMLASIPHLRLPRKQNLEALGADEGNAKKSVQILARDW